MVTHLGTLEEYKYENHKIKIKQQHFSGDRQLTFYADVEGKQNFRITDYAHNHEGLIGLFSLKTLIRKISSDYEQRRIQKLKQRTENEIDVKNKMIMKKEALEKSLQ